jgi:hypothetical protein
MLKSLRLKGVRSIFPCRIVSTDSNPADAKQRTFALIHTVIQAAISQAPAIIVTPAIIFVILLAAGLAGVLVGCKQEADDSR